MRPARVSGRRGQIPGSGGAMRAALERRLAEDGHPWPEAGAALVLRRGLLRLDRDDFAVRLGCRAALLADVESGHRHPAELPSSVLNVDPDTDWVTLVLATYGPGPATTPEPPRAGTLGNELVRRRLLAVASHPGPTAVARLPGFEDGAPVPGPDDTRATPPRTQT